jgi:N-acetylglucosaminyl-diphospho-decaprenol L-rhamnosyltransferase
MACGAAVLTTDRLSLPEVGGDAVAYTEPEPEAIAQALRDLLDDPARRASSARRGTPARCSSPGRPAPRRTWPPSPAPCRRDPLPTVSGAPLRVVVVTYSPGDSLPAFLSSLATATSRPYEVVLADNGSTDGAPEAAVGPGVELLRTGGNVGYGRAANLGASGFTGDWLVVANPDVTWAPGALDALVDAGLRWPHAGCLGPGILTPDGQLFPSARAFPSLGRGAGHAVFGWIWPSNPWTRAYRAESGVPVEGTAGWLSGSCMLLRREAFEAVAGFDPSYFMYCEDMDLCRRLWEAAGRASTCRAPSSPTRAATRRPRPRADAARAPPRAVPLPVPAVLRAGVRTGAAGARARPARALPARSAGPVGP